MTKDLVFRNAQAHELLSTLQRINDAWNILPSKDEINILAQNMGDMADGASAILENLREAEDVWKNLSIDEEAINALNKAIGNVADCLREARKQ